MSKKPALPVVLQGILAFAGEIFQLFLRTTNSFTSVPSINQNPVLPVVMQGISAFPGNLSTSFGDNEFPCIDTQKPLSEFNLENLRLLFQKIEYYHLIPCWVFSGAFIKVTIFVL